MKNQYYLIFNQKSNLEVGLSIVSRPNIPSPKQKTQSVSIPGTDGTYTEILGYEDLSISVEFNKKCRTDFQDFIRKVNEWFYHLQDRKLYFSDDLEFYYRVKRVVVEDKERHRKHYTKFKVTFICEPYQYTEAGRFGMTIQSGAEIYNPYYVESLPVFKLYGEGLMTLNINEQILEVNVGQTLIIDSEKKLTYREDGTLCNANQRGAYPVLEPGRNVVSITGGQLEKMVIQTNLRTR